MAKTKLLSLLGVGLVSLFTYTFHTHFQLPNDPNDLTLQDWPVSPCFTVCSHNTMFVGLLFYTPECKHTEGRKLRFQATEWPKQNCGGGYGGWHGARLNERLGVFSAFTHVWSFLQHETLWDLVDCTASKYFCLSPRVKCFCVFVLFSGLANVREVPARLMKTNNFH